MTPAEMPIEHALVRSTVRLSAGFSGAPPTSVGTGFFYKVVEPTANIAKILIITNKHVVRGAEVIHFVLSFATSAADLNEQHQPVGRKDLEIAWPLEGNLYPHPDTGIDLCGIDVTIPVGNVMGTGNQLRMMCLDAHWLPQSIDKKNMRDVEQVLVIGYPRGVWDHHNNMPIARLGTTATHPLAHYQNKREFLVDVAAFQGSSGSPVFSYEAPMFRQADGSFTPGTKVQLIGVVWGIIESSVEGELKVVEIPSSLKQVPVISTSLNLAIALHADAIREIDEQIFPGITGVQHPGTGPTQ
ncbi:Trypsin-like peptidase domain-containing protein [Collimonas sp. OK307]|uniref:trypsin-like peptidase domain-containing protein n=1 Tax=Collimonas sp. OK307 TaxID=1801620 RepID=UPI0008E810AA|nr:trypsin-like peptidase domain-containing protein [Collimonas sp. OK307]SFI24047.1 Trypsin-like peptidase domain-containing protein [Collimonas sp. OK307]